MTEPTHQTVVCEKCGLKSSRNAYQCRRCYSWLPAAYVGPDDERPPRQEITAAGVLLFMLIILVCGVLIVDSPGFGVGVALVVIPAYLRTADLATRRIAMGRPLNVETKTLLFIGSLAFMLAVWSLVAVATFGAFFILCASMFNRGQAGGLVATYLAVLVGLIAAVAVAVQLSSHVKKRLFWPWDHHDEIDVVEPPAETPGPAVETPKVSGIRSEATSEPGNDLVSTDETQSGQFSLATILLLFTSVAVCLAITRRNLVGGITLVALLVPAIVRTAWLTKRRKELNLATPPDMQSASFVGSLFTVLVASGMILAASLGTFFLITTGILATAAPQTSEPIGVLASLAATILSITLIIAWIRWRWRRDVEKRQ